MATKAQIEANRLNSQASTGPRTDAGKAKTRQNALRHGLCAGIPQMHDETEEDVQLLLATLREEHEPVGAHEEILVYKMAEHFFGGKRASYLLSEQLTYKDTGSDNTREIGLMLRYHTTADRGYHKAYNELRKAQKERQLQEIGSVSQNPQPEPEAPPAEPPPPTVDATPAAQNRSTEPQITPSPLPVQQVQPPVQARAAAEKCADRQSGPLGKAA